MSSLLACVWRNNNELPQLLDHSCWSDVSVCREKKVCQFRLKLQKNLVTDSQPDVSNIGLFVYYAFQCLNSTFDAQIDSFGLLLVIDNGGEGCME